MDSAEFRYDSWYRYLVILGLPVWGLLIVVAFYGGFASAKHGHDVESMMIAIGGFVFGTWLTVMMYVFVRYFYAYRCRYVVNKDGVNIDGDGPSRFISWSGFEAAEYFPLLYLIRLHSSGEPRPIALFLAKQGRFDPESESRNKRAMQYMSDGLHDRFAKKWTIFVQHVAAKVGDQLVLGELAPRHVKDGRNATEELMSAIGSEVDPGIAPLRRVRVEGPLTARNRRSVHQTVRSLVALAMLVPAAAKGCELTAASILDELSASTGRDVVSRLWDGHECESALLDQISRGSPEWLKVALALEPYSDAAAGESLEAALSEAMQRAPSRVLPLLDQSRFGKRLCVPSSFDDSDGSAQRFRAQLAAARSMYLSYIGTSLARNARICLNEVGAVEASLPKPASQKPDHDSSGD